MREERFLPLRMTLNRDYCLHCGVRPQKMMRMPSQENRTTPNQTPATAGEPISGKIGEDGELENCGGNGKTVALSTRTRRGSPGYIL